MVVPSIYVTSVTKEALGKTAICLGLALNLKKIGFRVGYFKPLGWKNVRYMGEDVDSDSILMKDVLRLDCSVQCLNPIRLDYHYLEISLEEDRESLIRKIEECYSKVSKDRDVVIIESWHEPGLGASLGLSATEIAKALGSNILFVTSTCYDGAIDEILYEAHRLKLEGVNYAGVIFNCIREGSEKRVKNLMVPLLEKRGSKVWGVIPHYHLITAPTVEELLEFLGGKILVGKEHLSKIVENFLVGAMTQESAIKYFRKAPRKAVITGGDRPDIALTAMETDTSVIILTGNLYPDVRVLAKAEEKEIPIILVSYDTFYTVQKVREVTGKIKAGDEKRIKLAEDLVTKHVDWEGLMAHLGIKVAK